VQWWDPWAGRIVQEKTVAPSASTLRLAVSAFARDIAGKIERP
jgi:hypothetical protein